MARPRFVVDVVKNETSAPSPTAVQPSVQPVSSPPAPRHRVYLPQVVKDSFDAGEERLQRMFQEDQLELARAESPSLQKPRTPGRTTTTQEQAFLQQPIQKPLSKIERVYQQQYNDEVPEEKVKKRSYKNIFNKIPRAPQLPKWQYWVIGLIGGVVLVVGSSVLFIRWQINQAREQTLLFVEDLRQGRMTSARERLESLRGTYTQASTLYGLGRGVVLLTQGQEKANHIDSLFELGQSGLRIADTGIATYDNIEKGYKQFVGSDSGESLPTFQATAGQLEGLYTDLSHFQAQVEQLHNPYDREEIDILKEKVRADVPTIRRFLLAGQQLNTILPTLLGEDEKKEYLILLQNNQELRPTGGFIGSFALLTVEKGKLLDFKVEDVYEADGQLKGYVTPPPEIVEYLGEAQWHLRDVNWSPDFPTVAQQAGWFLDKTIGVQPDGVIGINLYVAQKLLAVTGPIELIDYKEVVTQENLYHLAHRHSEINFFAGSTQKRDFLSAVANQLFQKLFSDGTNKLAIMQAFLHSAEEAQLQASFNDPQALAVMQGLGWSGAVLTPQCPPPFASKTCQVDTVMQVEANVGVNKANEFIERDITHNVTVNAQEARHVRTIHFTNRAEKNAWPQGAYRNYIRFFVSAGAQLESVLVNNQPLDPKLLRTTDEHGKRVFGFYNEVPIKSTNTIEITYRVPLQSASPLVYALFDQKQSGIAGGRIQHEIRADGRKVTTVAPEPETMGQTIVFTADQSRHRFVAIEVQ